MSNYDQNWGWGTWGLTFKPGFNRPHQKWSELLHGCFLQNNQVSATAAAGHWIATLCRYQCLQEGETFAVPVAFPSAWLFLRFFRHLIVQRSIKLGVNERIDRSYFRCHQSISSRPVRFS